MVVPKGRLNFPDSTGFCGWWNACRKTMEMVPLIPPYGGERHPAQQEAQENHPWAISLSVCRVPVKGSIAAYVDDPAQYRQSLGEMLSQYPALFPQEMDQGFPLHDSSVSIKQDLIMRRITLHTTEAVFTLRPSCVMPSMIARTDEVEKALSLRQWGGPFDALASVFGRNAMCW